MSLSEQIAKHYSDVHFGGNWTWSNLKDTLEDVTWEEATQEVEGLNSILKLTFHINYFVRAQLDVLSGKPLTSKDSESFDHPVITSEEEWRAFVQQCLQDGEALSKRVQALPEETIWSDFVDPKYGSYFRNLIGAIEHTHYHLGQISLLKKLVRKG